jgi:hypothetical protein
VIRVRLQFVNGVAKLLAVHHPGFEGGERDIQVVRGVSSRNEITQALESLGRLRQISPRWEDAFYLGRQFRTLSEMLGGVSLTGVGFGFPASGSPIRVACGTIG